MFVWRFNMRGAKLSQWLFGISFLFWEWTNQEPKWNLKTKLGWGTRELYNNTSQRLGGVGCCISLFARSLSFWRCTVLSNNTMGEQPSLQSSPEWDPVLRSCFVFPWLVPNSHLTFSPITLLSYVALVYKKQWAILKSLKMPIVKSWQPMMRDILAGRTCMKCQGYFNDTSTGLDCIHKIWYYSDFYC